jgi:hypothetical protein
VAKKKKSLGRDPFTDANQHQKSETVGKLIKGKSLQSKPDAREVLVNVKLTPSNIKHLDVIRTRLEERGKGKYTRNDLIRIAITLLSEDDV